MKGFPDLPPLWLAGFMGATWVLARYVPLAEVFGQTLGGVGGALILAALALILWSAIWFRRKRTTIEPHHDPSDLIVEGPYRISRNPIYVGLLAILVGYVLRSGALSPVVLPFLFAAVLQSRFIAPEEAALRREFGARAERYFDRTRRWL